jgi:phytanoyl-CoA hydroxylase
MSLTSEQVAFFHREGYLVVPDLFAPTEFDDLKAEIAALIEETANRLHAEGKIENTHADAPFEQRLTRLLHDNPDLSGVFFRAIEGNAGGGHAGKAMYDMILHPRLLDAMQSLVGEEIIGSSVCRIRPKVPGLAKGVVPWHQDSGYFSPHCDRNLIVTCWIPLVDATPENGCLQVLPRTHTNGVVRHHTGGNAGFLVIVDEDLPDSLDNVVTVPVPLGGALFLTNTTPHCSLPNTTDVIRWSIDLRYQSADAPHNAEQLPEDFSLDAPPHLIACYPPEGDFWVRSAQHPDRVLCHEEFSARRAAYEANHPPGPGRWKVSAGDR